MSKSFGEKDGFEEEKKDGESDENAVFASALTLEELEELYEKTVFDKAEADALTHQLSQIVISEREKPRNLMLQNNLEKKQRNLKEKYDLVRNDLKLLIKTLENEKVENLKKDDQYANMLEISHLMLSDILFIEGNFVQSLLEALKVKQNGSNEASEAKKYIKKYCSHCIEYDPKTRKKDMRETYLFNAALGSPLPLFAIGVLITSSVKSGLNDDNFFAGAKEGFRDKLSSMINPANPQITFNNEMLENRDLGLKELNEILKLLEKDPNIARMVLESSFFKYAIKALDSRSNHRLDDINALTDFCDKFEEALKSVSQSPMEKTEQATNQNVLENNSFKAINKILMAKKDNIRVTEAIPVGKGEVVEDGIAVSKMDDTSKMDEGIPDDLKEEQKTTKTPTSFAAKFWKSPPKEEEKKLDTNNTLVPATPFGKFNLFSSNNQILTEDKKQSEEVKQSTSDTGKEWKESDFPNVPTNNPSPQEATKAGKDEKKKSGPTLV